ncbi:MAG: type II toxin-antitoxin system HicA family toxin [Caldilineaceae bacterium]|nr:type II toxin-antitoxin system HicA family toxin [Caldilineaceae bacterium]
MRLPRDWSGDDLIRRLRPFGYEPTRQTSRHVRLTRQDLRGEHHITIPRHANLRIGTLNRILSDVADHLGLGKDELLRKL